MQPHHLPVSVGCGTNFVVIKTNGINDTYTVITKYEGHPGTVVPYEYVYPVIGSLLTSISSKVHSKLLPCSQSDPETWFSSYMIMGIVCFKNSNSYLILVTGAEKVGSVEGKRVYRITKTIFLSFAHHRTQDLTVFTSDINF